MYDFIIQIILPICVAMIGSFLGLICYRCWERRQVITRIKYHVVADLMNIECIRKSDYINMLSADIDNITMDKFKQTLNRIISEINLITDQKTMDIKGRYFELPLEESLKIQIVYNAVDQFNITMQKCRSRLNKMEITNEHLSKKSEIFNDVLNEWDKINKPLILLTQTNWYKKIKHDLDTNPKYLI